MQMAEERETTDTCNSERHDLCMMNVRNLNKNLVAGKNRSMLCDFAYFLPIRGDSAPAPPPELLPLGNFPPLLPLPLLPLSHGFLSCDGSAGGAS